MGTSLLCCREERSTVRSQSRVGGEAHCCWLLVAVDVVDVEHEEVVRSSCVGQVLDAGRGQLGHVFDGGTHRSHTLCTPTRLARLAPRPCGRGALAGVREREPSMACARLSWACLRRSVMDQHWDVIEEWIWWGKCLTLLQHCVH